MTLANGRSGSRFYYGGDNSLDALPQINPGNPTMTAPFTCMIPRAAFGDADAPAAATQAVPARPSLYGHGLPRRPDEVAQQGVRAGKRMAGSVDICGRRNIKKKN